MRVPGALRRTWALALQRLREFAREPASLAMTFALPLVLSVVLELASGGIGSQRLPLGVAPSVPLQMLALLRADPDLELVTVPPQEHDRAMAEGRIVAWIEHVDPLKILAKANDSGRTAGLEIARALAIQADTANARRVQSGAHLRWTLCGVLCLNILTVSLLFVGVPLARLRQLGILRHMAITPAQRGELFCALMGLRLPLALVEGMTLFGFATLIFRQPLFDNFATMVPIMLLAAAAFSGFGLFLGARAKSLEVAINAMQAIALPLTLASDTLFRVDSFPEWSKPLIRWTPLGALNAAMRDVVIRGASFAQVLPELSPALLAGCAFGIIGALLFRWS